MFKLSRLTQSVLIVSLILIVDQVVKIWVKSTMSLGDEFSVIGNWFIIHFVENNGMAFGFEFAGQYGKIFLSVFRIAAVLAIGWYLLKLVKRTNIPMGFIVCVSMIFAGAIGNIIDSALYGLIFSDSYGKVATLFPDAGGYASFLHGRVVDMFYFPLFQGHYPNWVPMLGGEEFLFFRPVFNIADSAITVGIFCILIFYRRLFSELDGKKKATPDEENKELIQEEASEN